MKNNNITWQEIPTLIDEKHYVESRFEEVYPYIIEENEKIFLLPDCVKMHVDKISSWGCLVMEYSDPGMDVLGEDGDTFYRLDYKTPDAMFQDMLMETKG